MLKLVRNKFGYLGMKNITFIHPCENIELGNYLQSIKPIK
jgi:hypothetical protein